MSDRCHAIDFIASTFETLRSQTDLSPENEIVTACLTRFVVFLGATYREEWASALPDAPELAEAAIGLPDLCGAAECEMEKWWCRRFIAERPRSPRQLNAFWYFENYRHLTNAELTLLNSAGSAIEKVTLLGSGALPLTAILLAEAAPRLFFRCVDKDAQACDLSHRLIKELGLAERIEIVQGAAEEHSFGPDDSAICASLLSAPALYGDFLRARLKTFIVRDAEGLFRLCYKPAIPPPEVYRAMSRTTPSPDRINVSYLYALI